MTPYAIMEKTKDVGGIVMFLGFSPDTVDFLWGIRWNNNREWFLEHKQDYVNYLYEPMKALGKELFALTWWQLLLTFAAILMLISGPSMVMAWMKLRRRNIAPLLNANGWAVNAAAKISIPFGNTLTDVAKFPKMKLKDPYAKAGMLVWAKVLITLCILAGAAAAAWYFGLITI